MGHQPFGLFLCICFYVERAFGSWKSGCSGQSLLEDDWMEQRSNRIDFVIPRGKNHTRRDIGKHTAMDRLASTE